MEVHTGGNSAPAVIGKEWVKCAVFFLNAVSL